MKENVWKIFRLAYSNSIPLVGFLLALVFWIVTPDKPISLKWVVPFGIVFVMLILTLGNVVYRLAKGNKRNLPKMLMGKTLPSKDETTRALCLLEPSEFFSYDTLVSFYYIDDEEFEQLVGIGTVVNIQENKLIQVELTSPVEGYEGIVKKLANNDAHALKKTVVKPSIPKKYLALYF